MKRTMLLMTAFVILWTCSGCVLLRAFEPDKVLKHPDAPLVILEVNGHYANVAVYSKADNRLLEYGWIDLAGHVGWTIHKFDWEKHILERAR